MTEHNTPGASAPSPETLFHEAFDGLRDPRSPEYRAGVLAALRSRLDGARIACPYRMGTAEADAWFSGTDEGHALAREALRKEVAR